MKIQRLGLGAAIHQILVTPAGRLFKQLHIFHAAIHLVGGGINEDGLSVRETRRLQHIKGAERIGTEIVPWIDDRGGDSHLPGQMNDHIRAPACFSDPICITHIPNNQLEGILSEFLFEPFNVACGAGEVIVHDDLFSALQQTMNIVRTDKPGAAGDKILFSHYSFTSADASAPCLLLNAINC